VSSGSVTVNQKKLDDVKRTVVLSTLTPLTQLKQADMHELAVQNLRETDLSPNKVAHKISSQIASNYFGSERTLSI
jgi:hypothetical protein